MAGIGAEPTALLRTVIFALKLAEAEARS